MKRELNLTNWCELPLAAAPLCYPPVLFWPRPGLEKCLIFSAFSRSNPTYYQEIWLFFVLVHHMNMVIFPVWQTFSFQLLATRLVICVIGQVGAIGVFSRPGRDHLHLLCGGSLASPTYQTYSRLTTHYHPILGHHSYCVPQRHCPYSSQSGAGVTSS